MSVVDYFLNSLVKYLQKKQKQRKKRKKEKRRLKKSRRIQKKQKKTAQRKKIKRKKTIVKKTTRKKPVQSPKVKKKKIKSVRKPGVQTKVKKKKVKKPKKLNKKVSESKSLPKETCIGEVTHYFSGINVIVLKMTRGKLLIGEQIHVMGRVTNFTQKVKSLQIESVDVKVARKGQLVGLKVIKKAKVGDKVFK